MKEGVRRSELLALGALTIAGAVIRLWLVGTRPLIGDEGLTWSTSLRPISDFLFWTHTRDHPPLSYLLVRAFLETFGQSVWSLRAPSAIAGIACIPAGWLLGRRFGAGMLLAVLMAFDPAILTFSGLARMYPLLAVLILVALWRMDGLLSSGERRAIPWLGLGGIILAATWTHYLGFVIAAVVLGTVAWRSGFRTATIAAIPPALGVIPPLITAIRLAQLGGSAVVRRLDAGAAAAEQGRVWAARLALEQASDLWPIGALAPVLTVAGLMGIVLLARRSVPLAVAVGSLALLGLAAVMVGAYGRPFGIHRYLVPWRVAISIGVSALVASATSRRTARASMVLVTTLLFVLGIQGARQLGPPRPPFLIGALVSSLTPVIERDDAVIFQQAWLESLGRWYGLPVSSGTDSIRRPDGALPSRTWLMLAGPQDLSDSKRPRTRPNQLSLLESAYGVTVDRRALGRATRTLGATAIAFTRGTAEIYTVER